MTPKRHFFEPHLQPQTQLQPDTQSRLILEVKQMPQGIVFLKYLRFVWPFLFFSSLQDIHTFILGLYQNFKISPNQYNAAGKPSHFTWEWKKIIFYTKDVYFWLVMDFFRSVDARLPLQKWCTRHCNRKLGFNCCCFNFGASRRSYRVLCIWEVVRRKRNLNEHYHRRKLHLLV